MCKTCGYLRKEKTLVRRHCWIHIGVKFPCKLCGKEFSAETGRQTHFKAVHRLNLTSREIREMEEKWNQEDEAA